MKEIEAIKMRNWINNLKEYGFTSLSISKYTGINEKSIRNFYKNKDYNLNDKHHKKLYEWLLTTRQIIITAKEEK
jgi:nitrogen regulatory protein PII